MQTKDRVREETIMKTMTSSFKTTCFLGTAAVALGLAFGPAQAAEKFPSKTIDCYSRKY